MSIAAQGHRVTLVDGRPFALRHVRPGAGEGAATVTVLGREYGFEWLPVSSLPSSPDLVEGSYTRRLGDAGEFTLTFPNVASSKGLWREKFSEAGALEFVEIYRDGALEFVGCIERVEIDRGSVTISGGDGFTLLKRAYERDRVWWDAPSTVIDTYTRVPVADYSTRWADLAGWTDPGTNTVNQGNLVITGSPTVAMYRVLNVGDGDWDISTSIYSHTGNTGITMVLRVVDSTPANVCSMTVQAASSIGGVFNAQVSTPGGVSHGSARVGVPLPVSVAFQRRGSIVSGFINGALIGTVEATGGDFRTLVIDALGDGSSQMRIGPLSVRSLKPFLRRGTERGDAVLPGDHPTGGLRGRYHNIGDLQGLGSASRRARALTPVREPYGERLDGPIDFVGSPLPMQPGSNGDWFAVRWSGAVYLPLAGGQVEFRLVNVDDGARLWVGRTGVGEELLTRWNETAGTIGPATTALGSATGWYPLRLEYYETTGSAIISLQFRRVASGWTDPGGTVIAANTWTVIPATSLSPLGCHEARIQGQSHFQIIQDAASQAGYELLLDPMSLESGEFPGRLVPRVRVGSDTDVVLEPDDTDTVEPILAPAVTRDSSDQAVRFIGSGSGSADGVGSQTLAEVADLDADALFELQAWADAGDASLSQLLEARLNAELALRATPWEEVRGTPRAMERLADTWPLTGALSVMRWRPGDGLRISVPDIGVIDTEPRRLTQVTRTFAAEGRTATTVGFRQRPRSAAAALRRLALSSALAQRSNQGRLLTLSAFVNEATLAPGGSSAACQVQLMPQDQVVRAAVRVGRDSGTGTLGLNINGTDRTTALGGGWTTVPLEIDITAYATQESTTVNRLYAIVARTGGTSGTLNFQLIVEVRR